MSYTYNPRPSVARDARGRGAAGSLGMAAGRGRAAAGRGAPVVVGATGTAQPVGATGTAQPVQEERVQRKDGFTMFAPDQRKRDKIAKQAQGEEEKYKKYKDSQKLGHVSYVGTAGGGISPQKAAQEKVQQNQRAPIIKKATFQEHRNQEKQREQAGFDQRKAAARSKANLNETKESQRQARLDEDRRRKNEEFLRRFENGS